VFLCRTAEQARSIILTPEADLNTNQRWDRETAYLIDRIEWRDDDRLIIDYGCGIGRMMKPSIPTVLGVDISPTMRAHGVGYLQDRHDCAFVSPECMQLLIERGLRAQGAMAIWSLQHVLDPDATIRLLFNALVVGSSLYVVNRDNRYVPARNDGDFTWVNDGVDIGERLESGGFVLVHDEPMPLTLCAEGAWFRRYERSAI